MSLTRIITRAAMVAERVSEKEWGLMSAYDRAVAYKKASKEVARVLVILDDAGLAVLPKELSDAAALQVSENTQVSIGGETAILAPATVQALHTNTLAVLSIHIPKGTNTEKQ